MLGTDPAGTGGVAAVIAGYSVAGLDRRWPIQHIVTHVSGTRTRKLGQFAQALACFLCALFGRQLAIVHAHAASRSSFYRKSIFLLLARVARVPTVLHLHGGEFDRFYDVECGLSGRAYVRFILRGCDRVLVLSEHWRQFMSRLVQPDRVVRISNGVIPGDRPQPLGQVPETKVILFLGRLSKGKGFLDLLDVTAVLSEEGWDVELWAAGDGDLDGASKDAHERGIGSRVRILGWIGPTEKAKALSRAWIFCLPSYAEGLPMALLEAMGAGLPVVTTPVGGIPEAVTHGQEGYLVSPGNLGALKDALVRILADDDLRNHMAIAARHRVETTFSLAVMVQTLETVYTELGAEPLTPSREA